MSGVSFGMFFIPVSWSILIAFNRISHGFATYYNLLLLFSGRYVRVC